jgi:hypothetical protein
VVGAVVRRNHRPRGIVDDTHERAGDPPARTGHRLPGR